MFLYSQFKLKDLECLKCLLETEIAHAALGNVISHRQYALQLLEDTGYLDCKSVNNPTDPKATFSIHDGDLLQNASHYKKLIGRLIYLTLSQPEITFAVYKLSQYMYQARLPYLRAVYYLLHYLKKESWPRPLLLFSSIFRFDSTIKLQAFSDADWDLVVTHENLPLVFVFSYAIHWSLGNLKDILFPIHQLRLSKEHLQPKLIRSFGLINC